MNILVSIIELLRWRPVNKFGMNHAVIEDDWYKGHFIPKGSVIMLNWWEIHYDENGIQTPLILSQNNIWIISSRQQITSLSQIHTSEITLHMEPVDEAALVLIWLRNRW